MIRATRIRLIISVLAVFLALPAGAQSVAPVGSVVNVGPGYQPGVVTLPSGDFVVVWQSSGYVDGSVVAGGVPGVSFPVSGTLANSPVPDIASDSAGNFVVAWNDNIYYAANAHVQLFDSAASPVGSEVVIATGGGSFSFPSPPKVDLNDSGQFVVTWGTPYGGAIWAQGFGPSAFTAFPISSGSNPDVAVDSAGNFLVTWQSYPYVWGQTFDSTGAPIALSPFVIGGGTGTDPAEPSVDTLGASGFVVVWNEGFSVGKAARQPFTDGDVWARFADTAGATGTQFLVAASPGSLFYTSGAKVSANGSNFVVTWLDGLGFSDPLNVQVMDNAGSPVGSAFTTTATASWNSVSINDQGTFTVAWNPGTVYGQVFQVCVAPVVPTLTAPANGTFLPEASPVNFSWSNTGADDYDLTYSVNAGSPTVVNVPLGATSTSISLPPGAITWSVVSNYLNCPSSSASATGSFTVCPTPAEPVRTAPVDATEFPAGSVVNFQWNAVANALDYEVWVRVNGGTFTLQGTSATTSLANQTIPPGSIEWYVIANFSNPSCPSSAIPTTFGTFTVCHAPVTPTLVAPMNSATVSSPVTFQWTGDANATAYEVFAGVNGATPSLIGTVSAPTTSLTTAVADGSVDWYVVSKYGTGCPTATSATGVFNVCSVVTPPTLVSPADGDVVDSPVTFQWTDVGASIYEVYVGVNGATPSLLGTSITTSLSSSVAEGNVVWFVNSFVGSCYGTSSTGTFTVGIPFICPEPVTPSLTAPDDGAEFEVGEIVKFVWTPVADADHYEVWAKTNGGVPTFIGATTNAYLNRAIPEGKTEWYVITSFGPGCETSTTASRTVTMITEEPPPPPDCGLKEAPIPAIVGEATTGETYTLRWEPLEEADRYHIQESADASFIAGIISEQTVTGFTASFSHPDLTQPTPFFYRVAGIIDCDDGEKQGPYSVIVRVVGLPKPAPSSTNPQVVTEFGNEDFVETSLFIPGFGAPGKTTSEATFSVSSNEPWLTASPPSGVLPPEGTTVGLIANPKDLGVGANTATVTVTRDDGLGKTTLGSSTKGVPVSVSLVTPVSPVPKTAGPPENALIIPAVANVTGATSKWFSDVKITNRSGQLINYQLNFSATDQSGTIEGKQTKVTIRPGQTVALDDVVRQWYGFGDLADGTNGALEIRPINFTGKVGPEAAPMLATVASSRTYTRSENSLASYGQFIPAVPFSGFLKSGVENSLLMMQQVSQTASLRTNFGLVEGAGKDVNLLLTAFDREGTKLGEFPVDLKAGEHKQLNSLLALNGISVEDGRMAVQIVSGEGAVTSYASVVAAGTGDPSLVPGVNPANLNAKKYVLPGVADLRAGSANWRSDVRIFNPNSTPETVNVFFYPQGETTPLGPVELQIQPGHIEVLPGVIDSMFGRQDLGGALHVVPISGQSTSLVITGETYDVSELGKYGQFIPAVTEENAIGVGSPGLEVMQVEASAQFRTNLGLAEVTGQTATVQIQLTVPNSLIAPTKIVTLGGNEFQQLNGIVREMTGGRDVYNGRLTVRVMGGAGKVTAYGSTVDTQTRDATFSAGQ